MKIIIVSATRNEISPLLEKLDSVKDLAGRLIQGEYNNHKITIIITGIGMVETTYWCTKTIDSYYNLAINAGICGSLNKNLEIGTVVNVYEDCFSELGAEDGDMFLNLEEMGLKGVQTVQGSKFNVNNNVIEKLPKVNGVTVNTVHGNEESIKKVIEKFHPIVESMEGAAFIFVCKKENIPHIQIRAVSNFVEKRNKENWNIPLAIKNLNNKLIEVLDSL